ncbi:cell surface protein [Actinomyces ruminicola]|uniref:cell surface protein n=1 Tax=Actinomyces ruminicola TaxID=332524 RepID=UPI0011C82BBC|nr:cell surface protein [Actinomyces ruminicola]
MDTQSGRFHGLVGGALLLLDVSAVGFYILWFIADNEAAIRAEAHGFDPQQLLANGNWLWLFANATLICLIVFNVILIRGWWRQRR